MKYDIQFDLATGLSAKSKSWTNTQITWSKFVERLRGATVTSETYKEFMSATKDEQSKIKDVGGYVGGYLRGGRRKPDNVQHRQLLTLDIDFAHTGLWMDFQILFDNAAVLHATHKHSEQSPRYRLLMPLNREVSSDEYVAISRKVAGTIGIELFDNTTFETNRLMFWPSVPKDVDYYIKVQDGPILDADEILSQYKDWKDTIAWPTADRRMNEVKEVVGKQEDPTVKKGIVGAFCRCYSIEEAIEKYLPDTYAATDIEDRYTYLEGSTSGGLIVYDGKWAFSHHGTDPCSGKLCNSFDLVRIHKFGHLDDEGDTATKNKESFSKMDELARADDKVKMLIAKENIENAKYDFEDDIPAISEEDDLEWMKELTMDSKKNYLSTAPNLNLIFKNDPRLKKLFRSNDFDSKKYIFGTVPWRKVENPEPMRNVDFAGVRNYIECMYGISGERKIDDALSLEMERNHYHPVRDYLSPLEWDGVPRIDELLLNYFGAVDNIYTREAIRIMLVGAVARVFRPGIKFDTMLVLVGAQGTKKSSFFNMLGKKWFSDTILTVQGKDALEQLQGAWILEMAELAGTKKAEVESVKHFIAKQIDTFRPAYGHVIETYPRQCVFFGTTNNSEFLRDPTGNRRFLPIDVNSKNVKKCVFNDLPFEVDQIWAEAVHLFRHGASLILSPKAEEIANIEQKSHSESDDRKGIIENYLDTLLPDDWLAKDIYERRQWLENPRGTVQRQQVCMAEIWCECLGRAKEDIDKYKTREINDILRTLEGWEPSNSTKKFPIYGVQKYYERKIL